MIKIEDDTVQWRDRDKVEGNSTLAGTVCAISCRVGTRGRELNFESLRLHCNGENQFIAASDSSLCIFVIHQHKKQVSLNCDSIRNSCDIFAYELYRHGICPKFTLPDLKPNVLHRKSA